jgi:hypothetical protein
VRRALAVTLAAFAVVSSFLVIPAYAATAAVHSQPGMVQALRTVSTARPAVPAAGHGHLYRVRPGDSLSAISAREYGTSRDWKSVWWVNRRTVHNPDVVRAGQWLWISTWHPRTAWLDAKAARAIPAPPVLAVARSSAAAPASAPAASGFPAPQAISTGGFGSFQACVIERESGGQTQVMNASGHYGLYQFDYGTWVSGGGAPGDFGHASAAEQNAVFAAVYAARGTEPWAPSDGC